MRGKNAREIARAEYVDEFDKYSRSLRDVPEDACFYRYTASLRKILASQICPCRFFSADGTQRKVYADSNAKAFTYAEILADARLLAVHEDDLKLAPTWPPAPRSLIVEHCSGCDRRVVKDGLHRLARSLLSKNDVKDDVQFEILEASSPSWRDHKYDMPVVCCC